RASSCERGTASATCWPARRVSEAPVSAALGTSSQSSIREVVMNAGMHIEEWRPDGAGSASLEQELDMLADILHAVVHTGAGVSFVVPFSLGEARAFWADTVLPGVRARTRRVLVARRDARIVGTVQIDLAV